jgi:hypothetical protein
MARTPCFSSPFNCYRACRLTTKPGEKGDNSLPVCYGCNIGFNLGGFRMGERPGPDGHVDEHHEGDVSSGVGQEGGSVSPEGPVGSLDQIIRDFEHRDKLKAEIERLQGQIDELTHREILIEDIVEVVDGTPISRSLYLNGHLASSVEYADTIVYKLEFTGTGQSATARVDDAGAVIVEFGSEDGKEIQEFGKGNEAKAAAIQAARDWVVANG